MIPFYLIYMSDSRQENSYEVLLMLHPLYHRLALKLVEIGIATVRYTPNPLFVRIFYA